MADTDSGSSSDEDNWFDPEDMNPSTQDLFEQQFKNDKQNNENIINNHKSIDHSNQNDNLNKTNNDNKIEIKSLPQNNNDNNDNKKVHQSEQIQNEQSQHHKSQIENRSKSNIINTSSFPPELTEAYLKLQKKNDENNDNDKQSVDPKRMIINKDTGLQYDIDNLPIDITETPMLSLQRLSQRSSQNKNNDNQDNDSNHQKKERSSSKNKYSNFFVKNFFLKKLEEKNAKNGKNHKQTEHDENGLNNNDDEQKNDDNNIILNRIKMKGNTKEKEMSDLRLTQKIENAHKGAIYCMEFSKKGDYLATGGQDSVLRIWTVCGSRADVKRWEKLKKNQKDKKVDNDNDNDNDNNNNDDDDNDYNQHSYNFDDVISIVAFREFTGHRADIIDISWSNGEFILSASIDQTVMLWHTSRPRCLCLFQHSDIVTSVQFHPNEDYLFLSGSFDSRLRLWNILEHRVVDWVQVPTLVTCTAFSPNGKFAIAGLYDGQCFFYSTQGHRLKYVTAIECRNSSGKYRKGRKVTGLQYLPSANYNNSSLSSASLSSTTNAKNEHGSPQLLITTNDSRLRLYNLSNFDMKCKYKGHENTQSQIHARFSPDAKLIICGSEDNNIYIWRVEKALIDESNSIFNTKKNKNRQEHYEYFKSHSKLPQVALFAPHRTVHYIHKYKTTINKQSNLYKNNQEKIRHIILTADTEGHINIYSNHSNDKSFKYQYNYKSNHHHHHSRHSKKSKKHNIM